MASARARPISSSNWREALTEMLDLPIFFKTGTVRAAMMPIMEMTVSISIKVNPARARREAPAALCALPRAPLDKTPDRVPPNRKSAPDGFPAMDPFFCKWHFLFIFLFPAQDVLFVLAAGGQRVCVK